jgi:hypothetical protein
MTAQNLSTFPLTESRIAGSIPEKGTVAEPGLVSIAPGSGVTTIDPVSVYLEDGIEYSYRHSANSHTRMYQR